MAGFNQDEFSFETEPAATPDRIFVDWTQPLLHRAVDMLTGDWKSGPLDLSHRVIVVSTRQAGRRLRESLSVCAAERGSAVLPPMVVTPDALVSPNASDNVAGGAEMLRVWADSLLGLRLSDYRSLFPVDPVEQNFSWALQTAADLLAMRATLGEAGLSIADAARQHASDEWREPERWRDLSRIEHAAVDRFQSLGLSDPLLARKSAASDLSFGSHVQCVTLLAVPDPSPLAIEALRFLAGREDLRIEVVVHAPESLADLFDEWGRPITAFWMGRHIAIPDPEMAIHVAADPVSAARIATDLLLKHAAPVTTAALAVCDDSLVSLLAKECHHHGLNTFDPSGESFERHELAHLLHLLAELLARRSFSAFSTLLRCPDLTSSLKVLWAKEHADNPFSSSRLLCGCDRLQIECLPDTLKDAADAYRFKRTDRLPAELGFALQTVQSHLDAFRKKGGFNDALTGFLSFVYAGRTFGRQHSSDRVFVELAAALDGILDQFDGPAFPKSAPLSPSESLDLLLRVLGREQATDERDPDSLDLQGWLEAAWEDAPHLILTGFNDRIVPEAITGDPFLPASSRQTLGLRTNEDRFARDAYFLSALLASRAQGTGQVDIILSRAREDGEPLRPSRLLFQCPDDELAERALLLFQGSTEPGRDISPAWHPAWKLNPPVLPPDHSLLRYLRVTDFSSYLACPFRFYLKRGLQMEPVDIGQMEMDARHFGTITHLALENFGNETALQDCTDAEEIAGFLRQALEEETTRRYGRQLPAPVIVQLDSARQRLTAAAQVFAAERDAGWKIEDEPEWSIHGKMDFRVGGMLVHGTIDRIERNTQTGELRVIDFKTSAQPSKAEAAHLNGFGRKHSTADFPDWACTSTSKGKPAYWTNLQVPLYVLALRQHFGSTIAVTGGYFNLPKAVGDVGIDLWHDLDAEQLESALRCAEGVVGAIRGGVFWPPNPSPKWEEFGDLLFGLPELTASPPPPLPEPAAEETNA